MMKTLQYQKPVPIKHHVDVFVAGGGPAGVAAAVAAARQGKRVFLAEAGGSFGGSGTIGLVPSFAQFTDGEHFLADGIGREVYEELYGCPADPHFRGFKPFSVERLKQIYDQMMTDAGVSFAFFTRLVDVISRDGAVDAVILSSKSGLFAVKASVYIDCTGDADLVEWAGGETVYGDDDGVAMPATLCSLWANIDYNRIDQHATSRLDDAFRDGVFTKEDRHIPGIQWTDPKKGIGGGNIGHVYAVDARDEQSLTSAMLEGRRTVREFERYYSEYLHGYEDMHLCYTADLLGIRESRRIVGEYVLTGADFVSRASFEDEVGRYSYPVDIHAMRPDSASYAAFEKEYHTLRYGVGESYGIPYRVLIPKGLSNVLTAGRCVSTDRQMQASIRVMPGCFITGQAAGVAAALAVDQGGTVRAVRTAELREKLMQLGAYLPDQR